MGKKLFAKYIIKNDGTMCKDWMKNKH